MSARTPSAAGKKQAGYRRGVKAEKIAALHLRLKGYRILARRYKTPVGEIDLIARKGDMLVFAEVKAHKNPEQALYAVRRQTRRRIEAAARYYTARHPPMSALAMRFDVLIVPPGRVNLLGAVSVCHLDNAWLAGQ